jgi:prephenate dehydrogenase
MIGSANHTPGVADQMLLCEVMSKVEAAIEHMRVFAPAHGHSMAGGHVRTALRYEREILENMMALNRHVGGAMRQIAGGG